MGLPLSGETCEGPLPSGGPLPSQRPLLSVIVPVYNEAATVDAVLQRVVETPYSKEVIVVDDGSTDGTADVLRRWSERPGVRVLRHETNRGKGAAIRTGLEQVRGRFVLVQDADLEYDPQDYPRLVERLMAGAPVVYGSRYLGGRGPWTPHRLGVMLLNWCVRWWYGAEITDEATCYKAFSAHVLRAMELECQRFEFCPEVTAKALRMGLRIVEVPIRYRPRSRRQGKKLRFRDGIEAVKTLWRLRRWVPAVARGD